MRFRREIRVVSRPVSAARLKAAERALRKQRERLPLFAAEIEAEQPTPKERIRKMDAGFELFWADRRRWHAGVWRRWRAVLNRLPMELGTTVRNRWNLSPIPGEAVYFADFVRCQLVELLRVRGVQLLPCDLTDQHIAVLVEECKSCANNYPDLATCSSSCCGV